MCLEDFLNQILEKETGIDPTRLEYYQANADNIMINYWEIENVGRISRDPSNGQPRPAVISIEKYFTHIGLPDPRKIESSASLSRWQFSVMNPWGYVGYQLGEALLEETGHYRFAQRKTAGTNDPVPSFYSGGVAVGNWAKGCREKLVMHLPSRRMILATDVNCWQGQFTGLDGVNDFASLMQPEVQQAILLRIFRHNMKHIQEHLDQAEVELEDLLVDMSVKLGSQITLSGCLAGAHLCGVEGLIDFLVNQSNHRDETGTSLSSYLVEFSNYSLDELAMAEV